MKTMKKLINVGCAIITLGMLAACANVPGGNSNPFRSADMYNSVPVYSGDENVRVLSTGELHFQ